MVGLCLQVQLCPQTIVYASHSCGITSASHINFCHCQFPVGENHTEKTTILGKKVTTRLKIVLLQRSTWALLYWSVQRKRINVIIAKNVSFWIKTTTHTHTQTGKHISLYVAGIRRQNLSNNSTLIERVCSVTKNVALGELIDRACDLQDD